MASWTRFHAVSIIFVLLIFHHPLLHDHTITISLCTICKEAGPGMLAQDINACDSEHPMQYCSMLCIVVRRRKNQCFGHVRTNQQALVTVRQHQTSFRRMLYKVAKTQKRCAYQAVRTDVILPTPTSTSTPHPHPMDSSEMS